MDSSSYVVIKTTSYIDAIGTGPGAPWCTLMQHYRMWLTAYRFMVAHVIFYHNMRSGTSVLCKFFCNMSSKKYTLTFLQSPIFQNLPHLLTYHVCNLKADITQSFHNPQNIPAEVCGSKSTVCAFQCFSILVQKEWYLAAIKSHNCNSNTY